MKINMGICEEDLANALRIARNRTRYTVYWRATQLGGKVLDRLSKLNAMALAAGMSYGKFMALHYEGVHIDDEEDVEQENLREIQAKESRKPGKCQWCNKQIPEFTESGKKTKCNTKFCSNSCRALSAYYRKKDGEIYE